MRCYVDNTGCFFLVPSKVICFFGRVIFILETNRGCHVNPWTGGFRYSNIKESLHSSPHLFTYFHRCNLDDFSSFINSILGDTSHGTAHYIHCTSHPHASQTSVTFKIVLHLYFINLKGKSVIDNKRATLNMADLFYVLPFFTVKIFVIQT